MGEYRVGRNREDGVVDCLGGRSLGYDDWVGCGEGVYDCFA